MEQAEFFDDLLLTSLASEMPSDEELDEIYDDVKLSPICPYSRNNALLTISPQYQAKEIVQ
jgi:hypothetical protein